MEVQTQTQASEPGCHHEERAEGGAATAASSYQGLREEQLPVQWTPLGLYAVSGRIPGDDDDTVEIIVAASDDEANGIFKSLMLSGRDDGERAGLVDCHGTDCYVISTTHIGNFSGADTLYLKPEFRQRGDAFAARGRTT